MAKPADKKKKQAKAPSKPAKTSKPAKISKPATASVKKVAPKVKIAKTTKVAKPTKPAKLAKPAVKVVAPKKPTPVKAAKPAKIAGPIAKPVAKVEVKKDKKKLEKEAKEIKLKGKKGKSTDSFEDDIENDKPRSSGDDEEDDDLFSEKKSGKSKIAPGERLAKEADLPTQKMFNLADYFKWEEIQPKLETLEFFLPKDDACMQRLCENIRTSGPYCRLHYIANWKLMQQKKELLKEGKLQTLIEDFVTKYPASFIMTLLDDLDSDREFHRVLTELNISDTEFEIEEVAVAAEDEDDDTIDFESRSIDTFKPGGFDEE